MLVWRPCTCGAWPADAAKTLNGTVIEGCTCLADVIYKCRLQLALFFNQGSILLQAASYRKI